MSSKLKPTKPGTTFKFSDATRKAFEAEEKTYFDMWRKLNPGGVRYGQLEKSARETLGSGRWDAANRLVALKCVEEDITLSLKSVNEWKQAFVKRFQRRHEKLVEPSTAFVPSLPTKVLDRLVDGLLDITSGRKLFREKEATAIDRRRGEIQGKDGVTNVHVGAWAVAEAELWDALSKEQQDLLHHEAQSQNDVSREDLPDLLSQLAGGLRKMYDPCLLTLICSVPDSSGQPQTIIVDSVPDGTDSSTDTISHALELRLPCSIAAIANEKAKDVLDSLRKGEPVPRFTGMANEMDSSLSSAIGEVAEYFQTVWAHAYGEDAIPWSDIKTYFDNEQWAFPGGLKDPALYDSWANLTPMLAYLRQHCGPSAIPAFEFVSQRAPSPDISAEDPSPCFISDVTEKNSTLREALREVKHFFEVLWTHASLDGPILWEDINNFYDTTRWSFPGGAFDPTVLCTSWANLRVYLDFLQANCGPEVPNRFHFRTQLPPEHLDDNGPNTPSESSFLDHDTVVEDGNGIDDSRNIEHSGDETDGSHDDWDVDIEDLFDEGRGTYIGHQKSDSSSDEDEPEEPVDNEAAELEIVEPSVTQREYEQPKIGGRKRKREPPIPEANVAKDDDEPPKKAKRRPGRPKAVVAPATITDPDRKKGRKKASGVTKINGARYAETTSPPRHFVPKVLETRLRNRTSAKQA